MRSTKQVALLLLGVLSGALVGCKDEQGMLTRGSAMARGLIREAGVSVAEVFEIEEPDPEFDDSIPETMDGELIYPDEAAKSWVCKHDDFGGRNCTAIAGEGAEQLVNEALETSTQEVALHEKD